MSQKEIVPSPVEAYVHINSNYPELNDLYQRAEASIWTSAEIRKLLPRDLDQINQKVIPEKVLKFVKRVSAFFAASDGLVMENIVLNLYTKIPIAASRSFFACQMFIEGIHNVVYNLFTSSYPMTEAKRRKYQRAIETIEPIKDMKDWFQSRYLAHKDDADPVSVARLVLYAACSEIIFFGPVLAAVGFLKTNHWLPCFSLANDKISPDEALHGEHLCFLLKAIYLKHLDTEEVNTTITQACNLAVGLGNWLLKEEFLGLTKLGVKKYAEFISDRALVMMGLQKIYFTSNPFMEWMAIMDITSSKTSFHDTQPIEYQRPHDDGEEPEW